VQYIRKTYADIYIPELQFRTEQWSLETEDGTVVQLLDEASGDPFNKAP
jgi:hypothetical protein